MSGRACPCNLTTWHSQMVWVGRLLARRKALGLCLVVPPAVLSPSVLFAWALSAGRCLCLRPRAICRSLDLPAKGGRAEIELKCARARVVVVVVVEEEVMVLRMRPAQMGLVGTVVESVG